MKILKSIPSIAAVTILFAVGACALFEDKHVTEGRKQYNYFCSQCHGEKGRGDGYNSLNLDPRPRDLSDRVEPYMAESTNEQIFKAIKEGVADTFPKHGEAVKEKPKTEEDEGGSVLMPYWGYTLTDDQIWSIVAYIRTLHKNEADKIVFKEVPAGEEETLSVSRPQPVSFPDLNSPEGRKRVEEGKNLYENRYSCSACHRIGDSGGEVGPDLSRAGIRLNANWIYQWIQYPQAIRHGTRMPAFNMPEENARAIVMYLKTLRAAAAESPGPPTGKGPS